MLTKIINKKIIAAVAIIIAAIAMPQQKANAQFYSVYGNALLIPTGTLNVGIDIGITPKVIFDFSVIGNPIKTSTISAQFLQIQPGIRFWFEEMDFSQFVGVHAFAGFFDIGNSVFHNHGFIAGLGASWGYQWYISKRFNIGVEFGLGLGYVDSARQNYEVNFNEDYYVHNHNSLVLIPTKMGVNLVYIF